MVTHIDVKTWDLRYIYMGMVGEYEIRKLVG